MNTFNDLVDGCIDCRPDGEKLTAIVALLERQAGTTAASSYAQNEVAVDGDNVEILAAADAGVTYRQVVVQNRSIYPVAIKYGAGADRTGLNGEIFLAAGYVENDGTGGVLNVDGYLGAITAASDNRAIISVVVIQ
jgi:hypothetical protein